MVKNPMKNYKFWFKLIGGVILLIFAIAMIFNRSFGEKMVVGVFGGIIFLYGLYRIYPLIKTLEKKWSKILCLVEILADIIVGIMMLVGGFNFANEANKFSDFMNKNFRFFLGGVVYLRGLVYCTSSILFSEKSDWKQFVANIICLTFGVMIVCLEQFNVGNLVWVMIVLAFGSGAYIAGEGGIDYFNYRKNFKDIRDNKETSKEKEDTLENGVEKGEAKIDEEIDQKPLDDEIEKGIVIPEENNNDQINPVN